MSEHAFIAILIGVFLFVAYSGWLYQKGRRDERNGEPPVYESSTEEDY